MRRGEVKVRRFSSSVVRRIQIPFLRRRSIFETAEGKFNYYENFVVTRDGRVLSTYPNLPSATVRPCWSARLIARLSVRAVTSD